MFLPILGCPFGSGVAAAVLVFTSANDDATVLAKPAPAPIFVASIESIRIAASIKT